MSFSVDKGKSARPFKQNLPEAATAFGVWLNCPAKLFRVRTLAGGGPRALEIRME